GRNSTISRQFIDAIKTMPVKDISITAGSIRMADPDAYIIDRGVSLGSNIGTDSNIGVSEMHSPNTERVGRTNTDRSVRLTHIARDDRITDRGANRGSADMRVASVD
ncbi:MAG: hypothetical protein K8R64_09000, partial [Methanosarcinaceae archaeon]|nr:hypothetical protein [Methanosarcinaceae archaeon]